MLWMQNFVENQQNTKEMLNKEKCNVHFYVVLFFRVVESACFNWLATLIGDSRFDARAYVIIAIIFSCAHTHTHILFFFYHFFRLFWWHTLTSSWIYIYLFIFCRLISEYLMTFFPKYCIDIAVWSTLIEVKFKLSISFIA